MGASWRSLCSSADLGWKRMAISKQRCINRSARRHFPLWGTIKYLHLVPLNTYICCHYINTYICRGPWTSSSPSRGWLWPRGAAAAQSPRCRGWWQCKGWGLSVVPGAYKQHVGQSLQSAKNILNPSFLPVPLDVGYTVLISPEDVNKLLVIRLGRTDIICLNLYNSSSLCSQ